MALCVAGLLQCSHGLPPAFKPPATHPWTLDQATLSALDRFRTAQQSLTSLSGRVHGSAREKRKRQPFKQVFAVSLPASLRLEVQSSVGQTLALFVCDGTTLYYKQRDDDRPFVGPVSPRAIQQTLGYDLGIEELIDTLLGRLGPLEVAVGQSVPRAGDVVFLADPRRPGRLDYGFDARTGALRSRTYYDAAGQREVLVLYVDYTAAGSSIVPAHIEIANLQTGDSVQLAAVKLTENPVLHPRIFQPPVQP